MQILKELNLKRQFRTVEKVKVQRLTSALYLTHISSPKLTKLLTVQLKFLYLLSQKNIQDILHKFSHFICLFQNIQFSYKYI